MIPIIILGVVVFVALSAKGGGDAGGGVLPGGGGGGGGGGSKPSSGGTKPKPKPPQPTKGRVYGSTKGLPDWFDFEANSFWISPDCDAVVEGVMFEPYGVLKSINAAEGETLAETLNSTEYGTQNSVYGFIDYLIDYEGFTDPQEIALRVMMEANALCRDLGPEYWPDPLNTWFESFSQRITPHVSESVGGIDFG